MRVHFGPFVFDGEARELRRGQEAVHLSPKAFHLLEALLESRPRALSKADLQDRLWPKTFVVETNLANLVAELRAALGETRRQPHFLRTVHGFGYAFRGRADDPPATTGEPPPAIEGEKRPPVHRLVWGRRVIALGLGENVLGRDEELSLRIDASGISRRHARIFVGDDGQAWIEDLGSKNGTYLDNQRLEGRAALGDGATLRLGRHPLVYRRSPLDGSTTTDAGAPTTGRASAKS